jgi:integral membrane protein
MSAKSIKQFRYIGIAEGISFILLLGIAMPLKYYAGIAEAVKYTGWIHGLLFMAYIVLALKAQLIVKWSFWEMIVVLGASLVPFGPFMLEPKLKRAQAQFE